MKALTCTQCGAVLQDNSPRSRFLACKYCGANLQYDETPPEVEKPRGESAAEEEKTNWEIYLENYEKVVERTAPVDATDPSENSNSFLRTVVRAAVLLTIAISILGGVLAVLSLTFATTSSKPGTLPTATPSRKINYQVKIEWDGVNDLEYYEMPRIDVAKLPSFDEDELKRTVFKDRRVQVSATIERTGEVSSASVISGRPILTAAAVKGAKKTVFSPRKEKATRILTYYFHLITD